MNEDFSKKTVIVLVALTLIISIVGTWTVIDTTKDAVGAAHTAPVRDSAVSAANGEVKFTVIDPPFDKAIGEVKLTIIEPETGGE